MPSHYNCCVPLCTNHKRKNPNLSFYRIPKDERVRKEYSRLIRNETLKLRSSHTRICSAHFDGGKKRNRHHLPSIFPWSKPVNLRKPPVRRRLDVASASTQSSTFDYMEVKTVEAATVVIEDTDVGFSPSESVSIFSDETTCTESKEKQTCETTTQYKAGAETVKENETYVKSLEERVSALRTEIQNQEFSIKRFQNDDSSISFYTGFPNYETLLACFSLVVDKARNMSYGKYHRKQFNTSTLESPGALRSLSLLDEFFLVLVRIRLGILERDLSDRFGVSQSTVSRILTSCIRLLREELEPLVCWPTKEQIVGHMPPTFKAKYPDVVVFIDCTEIKMETPSALDNQSACYSHYKSNTTMKGLVGITPSGVCSFVSDLYTGSISDKEIIVKSGFLDKLSPGDGVMTDKGFLIQDELAARQAHLVIPPLLKQKPQFTEMELDQTRSIANLRIHVERFMERIKKYHIFDRAFPISMAKSASDIFFHCVCFG